MNLFLLFLLGLSVYASAMPLAGSNFCWDTTKVMYAKKSQSFARAKSRYIYIYMSYDRFAFGDSYTNVMGEKGSVFTWNLFEDGANSVLDDSIILNGVCHAVPAAEGLVIIHPWLFLHRRRLTDRIGSNI